jgi:hypothetical protein
MAISYVKSYTNNTDATSALYAKKIDQSSYAVANSQDSKGGLTCTMTNQTRTGDLAEVIVISYKQQSTVDQVNKTHSPYPYNSVGKLTVKVEEKVRATSSIDDFLYKDSRSNCAITFTWDKTEAVDQDILVEHLMRAIGTLRDSDGGGWRIAEMMSGSINPNDNDHANS